MRKDLILRFRCISFHLTCILGGPRNVVCEIKFLSEEKIKQFYVLMIYISVLNQTVPRSDRQHLLPLMSFKILYSLI